jgi:protein-L-isoaspartate O-methyltransferase
MDFGQPLRASVTSSPSLDGRMVIPVGLPEAQQLVLAEKELSDKFTMKEIMPVLFSRLEESDEAAFRAS